MASNLRAAEKILILKGYGEGLLKKLEYTKTVFSNPNTKPSWLTDSAYKKVTEALLKKFPEFEPNIEQKTQGYDLLTGKAKLYFEELEQFYYAFVDAFEFKEAALTVLKEVASATVEMQLDINPTLVMNYYDLFIIYTQLNLIAASIEDRKIILAVYYKLFHFIKCTNEPSFGRVANYIIAFENPIKAMQEELKGISTPLGKTLIGFFLAYSKARNIPILRKEGVLNITLKPEDIGKPIIDKFHYQLIYVPKLHLAIMYGFLLCPEALGQQGGVELLKLLLSEGFMTPVYQNNSLEIHNHFEPIFANSKNKIITKSKAMVKDSLKDAVLRGPSRHRERRTYLRQELNSLLHLIHDKPALLGPKFPVVLGGMSLAVEEILWYYRHTNAPIPKGTKKAHEQDYFDNRISELIYLVDQLRVLIKKHKQIIQQYYLEYLSGADFKKLSSLVDQSFTSAVGQGPSAVVRAILDQLKFAQKDPNPDFRTLRLNWFRVESLLSSISSPTPIAKVALVVERMNLVINHSKYVDSIDELLEEFASLASLYYFREPLYETFNRIIKDGPNQPLHITAFLRMLSEFPLNANEFNPNERVDIGKTCIQDAEKLLGELSNRIGALINEIVKNYISFEGQTKEINASYNHLIKKADWKKPKDFVPPVVPGSESLYRTRPSLEKLRLYERNAWQLCTALNEFERISIYDHSFAPREYLRDTLAENFKKFIRASVSITIGEKGEKSIQRPSTLEKYINTYAAVLKQVEHYVDIDIGEMLRDVFLNEVWIPALGKSGNLNWVTVEETEVKYQDAMIGDLVKWYTEFVVKRLQPNSGIVYSPLRRGFVSKANLAFKAELYADICEMTSLARLIGPYGVKLIEREILKFILSCVGNIKEYISHNKQPLDELAVNFYDDSLTGDILKKFKDMDSFGQKAVSIGNAIHFRALLHEGLRISIQEKTPFLFSNIHTLHNQYKRNTFMQNELLPIDCLAADCGIELGSADQALKKFLAKAIGSAEAPLWDMLPYMFAVSFYSSVWKEAQFKPVVDAHTNNAHTLARAINDLIIAFKAINSTTNDEKEVLTALKTFISVSSALLLRIPRTSQKEKNLPSDFSSVIIFMDKFIESSPLLGRESLEEVLPYTLLRSHYKMVYGKAQTSKKEKQEKEALSMY